MSLNKNMVFVRMPEAVFRKMDEETVIVHTQQATVTLVNESGQMIWNALDGKKTAGEIAGLMAEEYDAPEAEMEADLWAFLEELMSKNLVAVHPNR
ncbi:MAG: PqqD family protein [Lentisphaerota bacterium]